MIYRVTHHVDSNLLLTTKRKLRHWSWLVHGPHTKMEFLRAGSALRSRSSKAHSAKIRGMESGEEWCLTLVGNGGTFCEILADIGKRDLGTLAIELKQLKFKASDIIPSSESNSVTSEARSSIVPLHSCFSGNQRVIGSHAKWATVIGHRRSPRPTRTNDNRCFYATSFGLISIRVAISIILTCL